jgi:hypothetical protein
MQKNENKLMAENTSKEISHHADELESAVHKTAHIPAWVIAKLERSSTDLSDVTHYLDGDPKFAQGGGIVNLDKIKNNIGEVLYKFIGSLNKEQAERMLTDLKAEIEFELKTQSTSARYSRLIDEQNLLLYRLGRDNEMKMAQGGGIDKNLPVGQRVSSEKINKFIDYVYGFYGKGGIYARDFNGGLTKAQITKGVNEYLEELDQEKTWGGGDSLDRERVREYLESKKYAQGGEIDEEEKYSDGGSIFDKDYSKLVGKRLEYGFDSRPNTEKWFRTIAKAEVTPENYRYRDLLITNNNGYTEIIKKDDINDFLNGEWVELRDSSGNYYVIKLMDKVKFEGGGVEKEHQYKDYYATQGGMKFDTLDELKNAIKKAKPILRKDLREGKAVIVFNGEKYFIGEKFATGGGVGGGKLKTAIKFLYEKLKEYKDRFNKDGEGVIYLYAIGNGLISKNYYANPVTIGGLDNLVPYSAQAFLNDYSDTDMVVQIQFTRQKQGIGTQVTFNSRLKEKSDEKKYGLHLIDIPINEEIALELVKFLKDYDKFVKKAYKTPKKELGGDVDSEDSVVEFRIYKDGKFAGTKKELWSKFKERKGRLIDPTDYFRDEDYTIPYFKFEPFDDNKNMREYFVMEWDYKNEAGLDYPIEVWVAPHYVSEWMEKGGSVDDIDMNEVEKSAIFYTDETRWSTKPTIAKFEKELAENKELLNKLERKEISPAKIVGGGYRSSAIARKLAFKYLKEKVLISERAIEILKERGETFATGGGIDSSKKRYILKNYSVSTDDVKMVDGKEEEIRGTHHNSTYSIGKTFYSKADLVEFIASKVQTNRKLTESDFKWNNERKEITISILGSFTHNSEPKVNELKKFNKGEIELIKKLYTFSVDAVIFTEYKNGGTTPKQQKKIGKVMHEFKEGDLKTSAGTKVTNPKQAVAIALSEAGVPKKGWGHKKSLRK